MAGPTRKIKLSVNMKPFVSRVVTGGLVQKAFAAQIGEPVGACVKGSVKKGMSGGAIKKAVRECAKSKKGSTLNGPFNHGGNK